MNIRFQADTRRRLKNLSSKTGVKMSRIVRAAVRAKLNQWERTGIKLPA